MSEAIIDKIMLGLLKRLESKPIIPVDQQLWDEQDIASYFKYSLDYTKKHIITNEFFPPCRRLPTSATGDRTVPRWKATDIIKYAMAFDKAGVSYR